MIKVNIGVDIGGMSIKAGLVDENGHILYQNTRKTIVNNDEQFLISIHEQIDELIAYGKDHGLEVCGIGFGVPGMVNREKGMIDYACNLGIEHLSLKDALADLNLPVYLSNDANVACLAEQKFGAAKGRSDVIMLTLGTGVGGGVVIDNKLFEGVEGKGTELGHMVICVDGIQCGCGRKGCFEAYASASALLRFTKEEMEKSKDSMMWEFSKTLDDVNGLTSFECAKKGDAAANRVVDKYIMYLGEGVLNFCNIFRPEVVVLGGGISNQKEYLVDKLTKYCADRNFGFKNSTVVDIVIAELKNDAGIIGAAHLLAF